MLDLKKIIDFAKKHHEGQTRRGSNLPYYTHPENVATYAKKYNYPKIVVALSYLHDTIEDSVNPDYVASLISELFPEALPYLKNLSKQKNQSYVDYIMNMNEIELQVKLCDMLDNLSDIPSEHQKKKYKKSLEKIYEKYGGIPSFINKKHWDDLGAKLDISFDSLDEIRIYIKEVIKESQIFTFKERFQLRNLSNYVFSFIKDLLLKSLSKEKELSDNFEAYFSFSIDSLEFNFQNFRKNKEIEIDIDLERFDIPVLEDINITIDFKKNLKNALTKKVDGFLSYDPSDKDSADVEIIVLLDSIEDFVNSLSMYEKNIKGTLSHELQHAIQYIYFGEYLEEEDIKDINLHIKSPQEIDARLEEILSLLDEEDERNANLVKDAIYEYGVDYLVRNDVQKETELFDDMLKVFVDLHMKYYFEKLGII